MTAVCALVAVALGAGALRVRGLLLAVVTFVFALAMAQYALPPSVPVRRQRRIGVRAERPLFGTIDLADQRTYYYVALVALTIVDGRSWPACGGPVSAGP